MQTEGKKDRKNRFIRTNVLICKTFRLYNAAAYLHRMITSKWHLCGEGKWPGCNIGKASSPRYFQCKGERGGMNNGNMSPLQASTLKRLIKTVFYQKFDTFHYSEQYNPSL